MAGSELQHSIIIMVIIYKIIGADLIDHSNPSVPKKFPSFTTL
jgi:hypothetical protein